MATSPLHGPRPDFLLCLPVFVTCTCVCANASQLRCVIQDSLSLTIRILCHKLSYTRTVVYTFQR